MNSTIAFYNYKRGFGYLKNPKDPQNQIYFHISSVSGPLTDLLVYNKHQEEPIIFEMVPSQIKPGHFEAKDISLDLSKRAVGYIKEFNNGFGWIQEHDSGEKYFIHHSNLNGSQNRFISMEIDDPVVFTKNNGDKGLEALNVVKVDVRCSLEKFADFADFHESLKELQNIAEPENWDYINQSTGKSPVLYSYINYTFDQIQAQDKIIFGKSSKDGTEYAIFNTGLVTPFQDEIYGYFKKVTVNQASDWGVKTSAYEFLEFETEQSRYRKFFPDAPQIASYFSDAEVRELIFDSSLNGGNIIVDKQHIKKRKSRFPQQISNMDDEAFFDAVSKSVELAIKRIKRNYKTAIPHFYDGKIQFLLPLCMITKKDADLALVVNKEEYVYKAHTVLTLDQAYNNARLLAKPDREWLNP